MVYSFIEWFVRKILSKLLLCFWLAFTSPPLLFLIWLMRSHGEYEAMLAWLALPLAVLWFLGSLWLSMTMDHYIFDKKQLFLRALRLTLRDLRLKFELLPIVGHFFAPDEDKTRYDPDDD